MIKHHCILHSNPLVFAQLRYNNTNQPDYHKKNLFKSAQETRRILTFHSRKKLLLNNQRHALFANEKQHLVNISVIWFTGNLKICFSSVTYWSNITPRKVDVLGIYEKSFPFQICFHLKSYTNMLPICALRIRNWRMRVLFNLKSNEFKTSRNVYSPEILILTFHLPDNRAVNRILRG